MSRKAQSESELFVALGRPDVETLRLAVHQWHQYYVAAFGGREEAAPPRKVSPELEPPDFDYFLQPRELANDHVMACMMIALADIENERFLVFWAWGEFWHMLHNASDALLARIEEEARRTPRFRWMLAHLHVHGNARVQQMLVRASHGAPADGKMPPAPWV